MLQKKGNACFEDARSVLDLADWDDEIVIGQTLPAAGTFREIERQTPSRSASPSDYLLRLSTDRPSARKVGEVFNLSASKGNCKKKITTAPHTIWTTNQLLALLRTDDVDDDLAVEQG
jgi:hypothetical protein